MLANLTAKDIKNMSHEELVELARAGQNEIRNDIRRFTKAGVMPGAFALDAFKKSTTEHDYKYSYYSIKERKEIEKTVHVKPEISYMARITSKRTNEGLTQYLYKLQNYFSHNTKTNTVEGILKHQRYIRFYMGGGEIIEDENGKAVDWAPTENFSDEDVKKFYDIYNEARKVYGKEFAAFYQSIRDAIVYNFTGEGNFKTMDSKEAAQFLKNNPNYVSDPSGTVGRDDVMK